MTPGTTSSRTHATLRYSSRSDVSSSLCGPGLFFKKTPIAWLEKR